MARMPRGGTRQEALGGHFTEAINMLRCDALSLSPCLLYYTRFEKKKKIFFFLFFCVTQGHIWCAEKALPTNLSAFLQTNKTKISIQIRKRPFLTAFM